MKGRKEGRKGERNEGRKEGREGRRKEGRKGISLVVQWLRYCASKAGVAGSNPSLGTKIPHTTKPKEI